MKFQTAVQIDVSIVNDVNIRFTDRTIFNPFVSLCVRAFDGYAGHQTQGKQVFHHHLSNQLPPWWYSSVFIRNLC